MAAEARERRPGGETVITRLADVLVIHAIRGWIEQDSAAQSGWLAALRDRQIGRALTLIHRDPARPWTLGLLASEVAMSRSAFAARFSELVGLPAMQYVARWRMHLATTWLRDKRHRAWRARQPLRVSVRGGVQPGLQTRRRHVARRGRMSGIGFGDGGVPAGRPPVQFRLVARLGVDAGPSSRPFPPHPSHRRSDRAATPGQTRRAGLS